MPSLSLIESEAQGLVGRLPEEQRRTLETALIELCEIHWRKLRGPEPATLLAQVLWSVTPPLADLVTDLYAAGDARLDEILPAHDLAKGFALLVLAEIERGNEAGVHIAHEPMMAFESVPPGESWLERHAALLRGTLAPPLLHHHDRRTALWKALAIMASDIKRLDLPAVLEAIHLLVMPVEQLDAGHDEALEKLRHDVHEVGIRFLDIDDDHIHLQQHGHKHKPVRARQLAEMLLEIRQKWLG